jgi:hypothetical protein
MGFSMQMFVRPIMRTFLRIGAPLALTAVAVMWAGPAGAQNDVTDPNGTGGSPTGLSKADFDIQLMNKDGDTWKYFNRTVYETFFSRARCQCDEPVRVVVRLNPGSMAKVGVGKRAEFQLRAGDGTCVCTGANCANLNCKTLDTPRDLAALINGGLTFDTTVRAIFEAGRPASATGNACDRDQAQNLWLWMDSLEDADADTELTDVSYALRLDGLPPAIPTGLKVTPGNEALSVSWDALPYLDDLQGYILFCSRGDMPIFPGAFKPEYNTPAALCPGRTTSRLTAATDTLTTTTAADHDDDDPVLDDATGSNGTRGQAPAPLAALDPQFACSDILTSVGEKRRLFQLQNGIQYAVAVASVDKRGNVSPIDEAVFQIPIPTRDFYNSYRKEGGTAEGGFCTVARGSEGRAPWLALAVMAPLLALLIRRTRRPR